MHDRQQTPRLGHRHAKNTLLLEFAQCVHQGFFVRRGRKDGPEFFHQRFGSRQQVPRVLVQQHLHETGMRGDLIRHPATLARQPHEYLQRLGVLSQ